MRWLLGTLALLVGGAWLVGWGTARPAYAVNAVTLVTGALDPITFQPTDHFVDHNILRVTMEDATARDPDVVDSLLPMTASVIVPEHVEVAQVLGSDWIPNRVGNTINFNEFNGADGPNRLTLICAIKKSAPTNLRSVAFQWHITWPINAGLTVQDDDIQVLGVNDPPPPELEVAVTAGPEPVTPGGEVTVQIQAHSSEVVPKLTLTATVPAETTLVKGTDVPTGKLKKNQLTWTFRGVQDAAASFKLALKHPIDLPEAPPDEIEIHVVAKTDETSAIDSTTLEIRTGVLALSFERQQSFPGQPETEVEPDRMLKCKADLNLAGASPKSLLVIANFPGDLATQITGITPLGGVVESGSVSWNLKKKGKAELPQHFEFTLFLKPEDAMPQPGIRAFDLEVDVMLAKGKKALLQSESKHIDVLCGTTLSDENIVTLQQGEAFAGGNWAASVRLSFDDGLVLENVVGNTRQVAEAIGVPYVDVETTAFPLTRVELRPSGSGGPGRSRIVGFEFENQQGGGRTYRATYVIDRIPEESRSCVIVTQQYNLEAYGPRRYQPWYSATDPDRPLPSVGRLFPTVAYRFVSRDGEQLISFRAAQRLHFELAGVPSQAAALYQDNNQLAGDFFLARLQAVPTERVDTVLQSGQQGTWDSLHIRTAADSFVDPSGEPTNPNQDLTPHNARCLQIHWRWGARFGSDFGNGAPQISPGSTQTVQTLLTVFHANETDPFSAFDLLNGEPLLFDDPPGAPLVLWYIGSSTQQFDSFFDHGMVLESNPPPPAAFRSGRRGGPGRSR